MIKYKNLIISEVYVISQSNKNCSYLKNWHYPLRIVPVKIPQDFQAQSKNFSLTCIAGIHLFEIKLFFPNSFKTWSTL